MPKFYCPKCGKEKLPDNVIGSRSYSARRLDLPYFMCGDCRLIYADRPLIQQTIREYGNELSDPRAFPNRIVCKEMLALMESVIEYYCLTASYRRAKFLKVPKSR